MYFSHLRAFVVSQQNVCINNVVTQEKNFCRRPCADFFAMKRDEPEMLRGILEGSIEGSLRTSGIRGFEPWALL